jgi:hypothetical protein
MQSGTLTIKSAKILDYGSGLGILEKELKAHVFPVRTSPSRKSWPAIEDICSQRDTLIFAPKPMPLYVDYADSLVSGMSVIEYKPKGKAANHMKEIANYIKNILK